MVLFIFYGNKKADFYAIIQLQALRFKIYLLSNVQCTLQYGTDDITVLTDPDPMMHKNKQQ